MAKTKQKEKEIELKVKADKISEEHLQHLQNLVNSVNTMQFSLGKIETQKHDMLHRLTMVQDRINLFQDTLKKEYGTYDVNISDGKINWPEENKEENKEDEK